jgi:2-oxoisovalerate dehydrogenase E2 component (dihydrolipoyl transacylase)
MKYAFRTPDLGEGTTQAEIVEWRVKVGDIVREDQPIADLMTDKATVEIYSPVHGTIVALRGAPGETMAVGSELVVFDVADGARARPPDEASSAAGPTHSAAAPAPADSQALVGAAPRRADERSGVPATAPHGRAWASPAVRRKAAELGVDLARVPGTGSGGRVLREDLEAFAAAAARPDVDDGVEEISIIGLRRKIAERLQDAKRRIPHITYVEELDVTAVEELRAHLNAQGGDRARLTLLPFLMRAIVRSVAKFPQVNAHFDDAADVLRRYRAVHIGVATQTPSGLVVPVARHAETLDLWQCALEIARLAEAARNGKATRHELTGSTITLSSLGALGGIASTPIINSPEVAVIGVNRIVERPVVRSGQIVVRKMMNLSSSFDHRIVDGWDAASFIQQIKGLIEQPATLFMDEPR